MSHDYKKEEEINLNTNFLNKKRKISEIFWEESLLEHMANTNQNLLSKK